MTTQRGASDDEEVQTPILVSEALDAGFTYEDSRQAEEELETPASTSPKVCTNLKEGSTAKKVLGVWVDNRRSKGRPWYGPLPAPRQSPLQTLGDAIADAKVERKSKSGNPQALTDRHRGFPLPQSSSAHLRRTPTMTVNVGRRVP
jgi:hypothetical protein